MPYANIRVVLVETTHPGNIGAVARAMKNMFLSRLYLVRPKLYPHAEATARASGADDLLAGATVCESLDEALAGCTRVYGASARLRSVPWPQMDARECGRQAVAAAGSGEVALLFGREKSGLTNDELARCQALVHIPTNPAYSSLNLAQAVQVVAYEVAMAAASDAARPLVCEPDAAPATAEQIEGLFAHLEATMVDIGFLHPDNPGQVLHRLRRLFARTTLETVEVNILRGILTAAQRRAEGGSRPKADLAE